MPHQTYRRVFGLLLGFVLGTAFGIVSQSINFFFLPGLPLDLPPFGPFGNALLAALLGTVTGLALAWPENAALGVILASLVGALALSLAGFYTGRMDPASMTRKVASLLLIFVPSAGLVAPLMILLRWIIGREELAYREEAAGHRSNRLVRIGLPVSLLSAIILLAITTTLLPPMGRMATARMQALIEQGQQSGSDEELPAALRPPDVEYFLEKSQEAHTLSWSLDDKNMYAIPRPAGSLAEQSTVVARFRSGYLLVCVMPGAAGAPVCRDFLTTPDFLQ